MLNYSHMSITSTPILVLRYAMKDVIGGIIFFPIWWYTIGFMTVLSWAASSIGEMSQMFGLGVWVRNLFVPMYGDTSIIGRLISFGIRLVMITVRGVVVLCWSVIVFVCVGVYLALLPAVVSGVVFHVTGLFSV